ncbi:hypothetical protein Clacol_000503 [Clathrus columnatus]|uniref:C2H2-type domain-containing protein n=1 Tax=Clathrus columnatus TaxID=1419009 RepID=A0AAV4ZYW5_9AGAM|nr:hypothetical protein Clacol_000503 [Clathrus columnatus]
MSVLAETQVLTIFALPRSSLPVRSPPVQYEGISSNFSELRHNNIEFVQRRIASLPPISAAVFNEKVLQRRAETAVTTSLNGATCDICKKVYTTENAYRSHLNSRKHKETELKLQMNPRPEVPKKELKLERNNSVTTEPLDPVSSVHTGSGQAVPEMTSGSTQEEERQEDDAEGGPNDTIDAKIAASRRRLTPNSCLFCNHQSSSMELVVQHMTEQHSFFIPDIEYLQDLEGLLSYLGEKVAVGNICLFCNSKSREFRTLEAVWKHMIDKSHCKIAYDTERDRLEISDFYDFSSSYPGITKQTKTKGETVRVVSTGSEDDGDGEEWEDVDEEPGEVEQGESTDEEISRHGQITYGDTEFELVLPSGARIGHRSLRRYYAQSFTSFQPPTEDPKSGAAIVRRLLTDKQSDLIPVKGGFGAFGSGMQVIKARNRGEAREAGRHIREFRDQKRKEDYKTRVAFVHNHQKHYRDPLLQVGFSSYLAYLMKLMYVVSEICFAAGVGEVSYILDILRSPFDPIPS